MKAETILKYIENKNKLTKKDYKDIVKVLDKYPYFQTAHILHLCSAKNTQEPEWEKNISKSSIFIADREFVYNLLYAKDLNIEAKPKIVKKEEATKPSEQKNIVTQKNNTVKPEIKKETSETKIKDKKIEDVTKSDVSENKKVTKDKEHQKLGDKVAVKKNRTLRKKDDGNDLLGETGMKIHNILMDEVFIPKIKSGKDENTVEEVKKIEKPTLPSTNKKELVNVEKKKPAEIKSTKDLTDDIFAKILNLEKTKSTKVRKSKEKQVPSQKEPVENKKKELPVKEKITTTIKETKKEVSTKVNTKVEKIEKKIETEIVKKVKPVIKKAENNKVEIKKEISKQKTPKVKEVTPKIADKKENIVSKVKKADENIKSEVSKLINSATDNKKVITKKEEVKKTENKKTTLSAADRIKLRVAEMKKKQNEKNNNLIEKFIQEEPRLDRTKEIAIKGDVAKESTVEKQEIITELMANIYINQGYYDKAITVFEKLILKNPKKKNYFAEKIKEAKKMKEEK